MGLFPWNLKRSTIMLRSFACSFHCGLDSHWTWVRWCLWQLLHVSGLLRSIWHIFTCNYFLIISVVCPSSCIWFPTPLALSTQWGVAKSFCFSPIHVLFFLIAACTFLFSCPLYLVSSITSNHFLHLLTPCVANVEPLSKGPSSVWCIWATWHHAPVTRTWCLRLLSCSLELWGHILTPISSLNVISRLAIQLGVSLTSKHYQGQVLVCYTQSDLVLFKSDQDLVPSVAVWQLGAVGLQF